MDIFKCALQHFVGDFARLLYGAVHNLFYVRSRIHRCPQNRMSDARPQHRELHALHDVASNDCNVSGRAGVASCFERDLALMTIHFVTV